MAEAGATAAVRRPPTPEVVYFVDCAGEVDTVASATGRLLRHVDVAAQLPIRHETQVPGATFDGCLMYGALYLSRQRAFYSLVPDYFQEPEHLNLWRFAVPKLTSTEIGPSTAASDVDIPTLTLAPNGSVKIVAPSEGSVIVDLTGYTGADLITATQNIESSDKRILVQLVAPAQKGLSFGVADTRRRTLTVLRGLPPTTDGLMHLAPGGGFILVETRTGTGASTQRTGKLTLFNAATGLAVREYSDARIIGSDFAAISPAGRALYRKGEKYLSLDLRQRFAAMAVERKPGALVAFVP